MSDSPPPTNYQWIGNTLSYTLEPTVVGLKLQYKQDGQPDYQIIYDNKNSAPNSVILPASLGPSGTVVGMTGTSSHEEWGPPGTQEITNSPTT